MSPFIDDLLAVQFQEQGAKKLQVSMPRESRLRSE